MTSLKKSISVIFPAYNEEANVGTALTQAIQTLPKFTDDWELIVVNDGSVDRTAEVIKEFHLRLNGRLKVIHHAHNRGYGAALKSGITSARKDLIFFCDSDLQFDIRELDKLIHWIDYYDIVIGFRVKRQDPFYRRLNAFGWNSLVKLLLRLKVKDIDCAFKLFRQNVFDKVDIEAVGAMVNTEILAQATHNGFLIKEVPVTHYPRVNGKQTGAKIRVIAKAFIELIRLYGKLKMNGNGNGNGKGIYNS